MNMWYRYFLSSPTRRFLGSACPLVTGEDGSIAEAGKCADPERAVGKAVELMEKMGVRSMEYGTSPF